MFMNSQDVQFKGFSPLRTPDVLKFVKQKHKKRQKKHVSEKTQHEISDTEGEREITEDLLKIACKVSRRLSSTKKDKFEFKSSDLPVDIDISPARKKLLTARLAGQTHQDISIDKKDSQMTIGQSEIQTVTMQQKSPKKHHRKKSAHTMSDTDNEVSNAQEVSLNENEDMHESPSILSGLDNIRDKSSSKKKHKSHKKHKKRKLHDESRNDSQDISESFTGDDDLEKNDVVDSSTQKLSDRSSSPRKQVDKSPWKQETPVTKKYHNASQNVSDEEAGESSDNLVTKPVLKYKVPENFTCTSRPTKSLLNAEVVQGKELWLIKAPSDFDMSRLSGQEISLEETSHLQTEDVVMDTFPVLGDINGVSYCPILPSKKAEKMSVGIRFCGQVHVTTSVEVPTLPKVKAPPPKHIATPGNLRPRYVPFGADVCAPSFSNFPEKHKKSKKRKHSVDETDDAPVHHKKKKKKHKHR